MSETREKLIRALKYCSVDENDCLGCERWEYECGSRRCLDDLLAQAAETLERQKWIPVTERLPDGECVAIGHQNEMLIGYVGESQYSDTGFIAENSGEHLNNVTHWMPLPELPKEG